MEERLPAEDTPRHGNRQPMASVPFSLLRLKQAVEGMVRGVEDPDMMKAAVEAILAGVGEDPRREGLAKTPERVAKMYAELTRGYGQDPADVFTFFEPEGYDELVLMTDIPLYSLCEHHMMPFSGRAHVGYLPHRKIVGLSKLVRLVNVFARRLQVQERLTGQVADTLMDHLQPRAAICVVEAEHFCVTMRGVQSPGTITTTSALRGDFRENDALRSEVLGLIKERKT